MKFAGRRPALPVVEDRGRLSWTDIERARFLRELVRNRERWPEKACALGIPLILDTEDELALLETRLRSMID